MQVRLAAKASASASAAVAVTLVADAFPTGDDDKNPQDVRSWPRCRLLEPHAAAVLAHAPTEGDAAKKTSQLLNQLAVYFVARAEHGEAEPLVRRALAIAEKSYGPVHPDVARDLNNLAVLLQATNRLAEAEPLMRRALAMDEASLPEHHPWVQDGRANLRVLLKEIEAVKQAPQGKAPHSGPLPLGEGDADDPTG